jgi:hypothetical protein
VVHPEPAPPRTETAPLHREHPPTGPSPHASAAGPTRPFASEPPPPPAAVQAVRPAAAAPVLDAEIAKAERLARIVVSDIILYNQEKFDAAVQAGNVVAAMTADLAEGRSLFAQRIDARVRESRDFLTDELLRVAQMRRSR